MSLELEYQNKTCENVTNVLIENNNTYIDYDQWCHCLLGNHLGNPILRDRRWWSLRDGWRRPVWIRRELQGEGVAAAGSDDGAVRG